MQRRSLLQRLIFAIALVGLLVAGYQTYEHYSNASSFCDISENFSCSVVTESKYGEFPFHSGLALAGWGMLWWIGILLFLRHLRRTDREDGVPEFWLFAYISSGLAFIVYLVAVEVYFLPLETGQIVICPLCTVQHVLILAIAALAFFLLKASLRESVRRALKRADGRYKTAPLFVLGTLLLIAIGGYPILAPEPLPLQEDLASCLIDAKATMYGFDACPSCNRQKDVFGPGVFDESLTAQGYYIKCRPADEAQEPIGPRATKLSSLIPLTPETTQGTACEANVGSGTPTWIINGEQLVGEQELETLAAVAGCEDGVVIDG